MTQTGESRLQAALAAVLPKDAQFWIHHISTPPRRCEPIFAAPPGRKEERTYCESHFLNVSIPIPEGRRQSLSNTSNNNVAVFAIELLVFTTKRLTTVFVSKADSTGYLHLLDLPKGTSSPLRDIAGAFVSEVISHRRRKDIDLVLTLFARSADQYLFPGSVENAGKHVADDRQLVKWWCRTLGPLVHSEDASKHEKQERTGIGAKPAQAYIIVPGEESIIPFLPDSVKYDINLRSRWTHGHPLRLLSSNPAAPPRCLIPRFPDDPKARFLDQLDEELRDGLMGSQSVEASPSKKGSGQWRSVSSLEQFWEMMAYRQECSSGRLVGFIWVLFSKREEEELDMETSQDSQATTYLETAHTANCESPTSCQTFATKEQRNSTQEQPQKRPVSRRRRPLTGPIVPRQPRIKNLAKPSNVTVSTLSVRSPYYYWPEELRGDLVLDDRSYEKATEMQGGILSRLDFAHLDVAAKGTTTWIDEVGVLSGLSKGSDWGRRVSGVKKTEFTTYAAPAKPGTSAAPNVMLVMKKKRKAEDTIDSVATEASAAEADIKQSGPSSVNVLNASLMRKKAPNGVTPHTSTSAAAVNTNGVNTLGAGLIRKKPKVQ